MWESLESITHQDNSLEHQQNLKGDTNTKKPATHTFLEIQMQLRILQPNALQFMVSILPQLG